MKRRASIMMAVLILLVAGGCGDRPEPAASDGHPPPDITGGPVSAEAGPVGGDATTPTPEPLIEDLAHVRPARWAGLHVGPDQQRLLVRFWADPCTAAQSIDVRYLPERLIVTLYQGTRPGHQQPCPPIATQRAVEIPLSEPLAGRRIVDGAREQ